MKKSSEGKKPEIPTQTSSAAGEPAAGFATYDLDSLAKQLGDPDQVFAKRTFAKADETQMVEKGTTIGSQNVVDDVPLFVGSALEITAALSDARKKLVRVPPAIYALIVHEAMILREKKAKHDKKGTDHDANKADREVILRAAVVEGIAERDSVYDALKNALGPDAVAELNIVVGTADSAEALAKGKEGLADLIDRKAKASKDDAVSLSDWGAGPDTAAALRESAKNLRSLDKDGGTAGRRISQRALDLQDGRVLFLIDKVLRAFRAAHRKDSTILLPQLNKLARMFEMRVKGKAGAKGDPAAKADPAAASPLPAKKPA